MGQLIEINQGEVVVKFTSPTAGKVTFADLGIKTVIDFRNQQETEKRPDLILQHPEINYLHLPIRAIKFDKGNISLLEYLI